MQFIQDILVAILGTYLAFTNFLADTIETVFIADEKSALVEEQTNKLPSLSISDEVSDIPDILLKNQEYQKASAFDSDINRTIENPVPSLVNIFCTFTTDTTIQTTTGTGFFVHSDGVILTNAHVAQYMLLEESGLLGESECLIRTGNPAKVKYKAKLLYISPTWIQKNASSINSLTPTGTGERDYALLYITESATSEPLPSHFPALSINVDLMPKTMKNQEVRAVGYPATEFLKKGASTPLIPESTTTKISELYTFGSNYADVFSVQGNKVTAEGSSGGPIVDANGQAIGIIVTRGNDSVDGPNSLRAITMSHVHRTILEETGFSLQRNLGGDLLNRSSIFTETMTPFLLNILSYELNN